MAPNLFICQRICITIFFSFNLSFIHFVFFVRLCFFFSLPSSSSSFLFCVLFFILFAIRFASELSFISFEYSFLFFSIIFFFFYQIMAPDVLDLIFIRWMMIIMFYYETEWMAQLHSPAHTQRRTPANRIFTFRQFFFILLRRNTFNVFVEEAIGLCYSNEARWRTMGDGKKLAALTTIKWHNNGGNPNKSFEKCLLRICWLCWTNRCRDTATGWDNGAARTGMSFIVFKQLEIMNHNSGFSATDSRIGSRRGNCLILKSLIQFTIQFESSKQWLSRNSSCDHRQLLDRFVMNLSICFDFGSAPFWWFVIGLIS